MHILGPKHMTALEALSRLTVVLMRIVVKVAQPELSPLRMSTPLFLGYRLDENALLRHPPRMLGAMQLQTRCCTSLATVLQGRSNF